MANETAVTINAIQATQQIRNLAVITRNADGSLSSKLEQVVAIADENGILLDLSLAPRLDIHMQLLTDIRKELMIQNELLVSLLGNGTPINLDKEYRDSRDYLNPYTPSP
jgi:hypothetical protein